MVISQKGAPRSQQRQACGWTDRRDWRRQLAASWSQSPDSTLALHWSRRQLFAPGAKSASPWQARRPEGAA